jgi:hypothetical protein
MKGRPRRLGFATDGLSRRKPREKEREVNDGIEFYMFDCDGFVLPQFREHVAALRKRPEMCSIEEVTRAMKNRQGGNQ